MSAPPGASGVRPSRRSGWLRAAHALAWSLVGLLAFVPAARAHEGHEHASWGRFALWIGSSFGGLACLIWLCLRVARSLPPARRRLRLARKASLPNGPSASRRRSRKKARSARR